MFEYVVDYYFGYVFWGLIVLLALIMVSRGIIIIPQAQTSVIERLGRYHKCLHSGINFIIPFLDRPRKIIWKSFIAGRQVELRALSRIDLREAVLDFPSQSVITKDNVVIDINALLYFQVTDPVKATYEVVNLIEAIEKLTQTTLRNVIGELDLDKTLASRDDINRRLRTILDEATDPWGCKVSRVELMDISPSDEIQSAMEKQMKAERDKRASILEAEGSKQSRILEAEGFKQSAISKAEGSKLAQVLEAEGQAEALLKRAEAEAKAILEIGESISKSGGDPTQYLIALKYLETLKGMTEGDKVKTVYLPYEATAALGALGGIKEILKGQKNL